MAHLFYIIIYGLLVKSAEFRDFAHFVLSKFSSFQPFIHKRLPTYKETYCIFHKLEQNLFSIPAVLIAYSDKVNTRSIR